MKSPSRSMSKSLRGQRPATSGPGPSEVGSVRQGMSAGVYPGNRMAGNQGPGVRCDSTAALMGDAIAPLVGGSATVGRTRSCGS